MPKLKATVTYQFDELNYDAKEKAREWYRQGALDYEWYDAVYSDAAECARLIGIDLNNKPVKLMNGTTRYAPSIWFTGFASQGDGACFEGQWNSVIKPANAKGDVLFHTFEEAIKSHAPQDNELHRIARELDKARNYPCDEEEHPNASTKHRGHYYHSGCMDYDTNITNEEAAAQLAQTLRDFADWIYASLEEEHDYLLSDEAVDESIRVNEYEFDEDGNRT